MEMYDDASLGESCGVCSDAAQTREESRKGDSEKNHDPKRTIRGEVIRLVCAALVGIAAASLKRELLGVSTEPIVPFAAFLIAYLLAGWRVILGAVRNLLHGRPFDELFLMTISTIGAFLIDHPEEAVGVMILYRVGEILQETAASRSRRSIEAVLALRPDAARVLREGEELVVQPESVAVGELVRVRPGERVPLDGIVVDGGGWLDTSALTGESSPRRASPGGDVLAGTIVYEGVLTVRVVHPASRSYAARIVDLVENASNAKARPEQFIRRFSRWYTPAVVGIAAAIAVLPPLISGQAFSTWIYRALVMLVISCPCALVISVPLGYFAGLGGAARRGILVKGSQPFEGLVQVRTIVFDKTGTLTESKFEVRSIRPAEGRSEADVLALAAGAETGSNHPIAMAIRRAFEESRGSASGSPGDWISTGSYREIPGRGVIAERDGRRVVAGTASLCALEGIELPPEGVAAAEGDSVVYVAENGSWMGTIRLGDALKPGAAEALSLLRGQGVERFVLLTGDGPGPARAVASRLGISEVRSGLLPHQKLEEMEAILAQGAGQKGQALFVGDGINDAPVLARADVGIAMGAGADAALETADVVLMSGELSGLTEAIRRARRTHAIVTQNIVFALLFKLVFLALGAVGAASMWAAVVADVGVALLAVLNSTRALR